MSFFFSFFFFPFSVSTLLETHWTSVSRQNLANEICFVYILKCLRHGIVETMKMFMQRFDSTLSGWHRSTKLCRFAQISTSCLFDTKDGFFFLKIYPWTKAIHIWIALPWTYFFVMRGVRYPSVRDERRPWPEVPLCFYLERLQTFQQNRIIQLVHYFSSLLCHLVLCYIRAAVSWWPYITINKL